MNKKELDFGDNLISIDGFEVLYTITRDFPEVSNFFLFLLNCVDKYNRNMEISADNLTENYCVYSGETYDNTGIEALLNVLSDFNFISFVKTLSDVIIISINPDVVLTTDTENNKYQGESEPKCPVYIKNPVVMDKNELKNGRVLILNDDYDKSTMDCLN